jgi:hypothetical protein
MESGRLVTGHRWRGVRTPGRLVGELRTLHRLRRLRRHVPNASASMFIAAKTAHLGLLPQGQPGREQRVAAVGGAATPRGFRKLHERRWMRDSLSQGGFL